jgi:Flp pilus assembly protein TadG
MMKRARRPDDGKITVFFAILMPAFLLLTGLVVDGGGRVRAMQRADNIAMEAARAAGQIINAPQAVRGGVKEIDEDEDAARAAAQAYWTAAGAQGGTLEVFEAPGTGDRVIIRVTVQVLHTPIIIGLFGMGAQTVRGQATATLVEQ